MAMDIKKVGSFDGTLAKPNLGSNAEVKSDGMNFRQTLSDLEKNKAGLISTASSSVNNPSAKLEGLKFSNHAVERMRSRGVTFSPEQMQKLEGAVKKAADKGGKDSLVLMNDTALIVSVKNNTVVTVVDKASLKENVFTNIDSTIVI